ncbi:MAG: signal peptidase II [Armatimonadetes bacterium]|nr:signal peptidase II [Armatimonadota bacterium]
MKGNFRLFLALTPGLLLVDQLVKAWARSATGGVEGHIVTLWPNVFELKLVYNEGVAFGMFQGFGVVLTPVAVGIAIVAAWYSWKHPDDPKLSHVTAALLASGSVGNLTDRLRFGKVTDMFWIRLINFPVFNVADVCITVAGTLLVWGTLSDVFKKKDEGAPSTEG